MISARVVLTLRPELYTERSGSKSERRINYLECVWLQTLFSENTSVTTGTTLEPDGEFFHTLSEHFMQLLAFSPRVFSLLLLLFIRWFCGLSVRDNGLCSTVKVCWEIIGHQLTDMSSLWRKAGRLVQRAQQIVHVLTCDFCSKSRRRRSRSLHSKANRFEWKWI